MASLNLAKLITIIYSCEFKGQFDQGPYSIKCLRVAVLI